MTLKTYLQAMVDARSRLGAGRPPPGYRYLCFEHFVLENGREYESLEMSQEDQEHILDYVDYYNLRFPIKQCFANCQEFLLTAKDKRFTYVEGFARRSILPVLHAWIEVGDGVVFDPTLRLTKPRYRGRLRDRVFGTWPAGEREYFGVRFTDLKVIADQIEETGYFQSLIDDWRREYPLLKENGYGQDMAAPGHHLPGPGPG